MPNPQQIRTFVISWQLDRFGHGGFSDSGATTGGVEVGRGEATGFEGGRGAVEALRGAGGGGAVAEGTTAAAAAAAAGRGGECWSYKGTDQTTSAAAAKATAGGRAGRGDRGGGGGEEEEEHGQAGKRGKEGRRGRELTLSEGSACA